MPRRALPLRPGRLGKFTTWVEKFSRLVKPIDWEMMPVAQAFHTRSKNGISQQACDDEGLPCGEVLGRDGSPIVS